MNKYMILKVIGNEESLKEFVQLCCKIRYCCLTGNSNTIQLHIDGDGSADLRFELEGKELPIIEFEHHDRHDIGE